MVGIDQSLAVGSLTFSHITLPFASVILKPSFVNKQSLPALAKSAREWRDNARSSLLNTCTGWGSDVPNVALVDPTEQTLSPLAQMMQKGEGEGVGDGRDETSS